MRLNNVIHKLVSSDQTGFIKMRQSSANVRRLLGILQYVAYKKEKAVVIALDAEKALDRVEWKYLFRVLKEFSFNESFINWIKLLYTNPQAALLINGTISEAFSLERGTKQGCPLSPLLFNLVIEPLAVSIRMSEEIEGIETESSSHKISLYADDVLLFLKNPTKSIPLLTKMIENVSKFSGYKINYDKSLAFPLGDRISSLSYQPFKVTTKGFKYLGIYFSTDHSNLIKHNLLPVIAKIKTDLLRWTNLSLSLLDRIAIIKMNVLPRLLYIIQMLPIYIPSKIFTKIHSAVGVFVWNNKRPRMEFRKLQLPIKKGGLGIPNFKFYHWAAQLKFMSEWIKKKSFLLSRFGRYRFG